MERRQFLLGGTALSLAAGTTVPALSTEAKPRTLLLVHGAMHGAWCWYGMVPRLRAAGFDVHAIDLPGRGRNPAPREAVTRAACVDSIVATLDQINQPVTLLGHDVGGLLTTLAAERRPEKISSLIYVAAFAPRNGDSLMSLALRDTESLVRHRTVISRDRGSIELRRDSLREVLYADCSEEDVALAELSLVPEATQPFGAPVHYTEERLRPLVKRFVFCDQDKAVGPALQRSMFDALAGDRSVTLACGHSPFFSQPEQFTAAIAELAT